VGVMVMSTGACDSAFQKQIAILKVLPSTCHCGTRLTFIFSSCITTVVGMSKAADASNGFRMAMGQ